MPVSDEWNTPEYLADLLGPFDMDPASSPTTHIQATRTCYPDHPYNHWQNGLLVAWEGSVFCNPPYSNPLPWCERLRDHDGPWCALLKLDPSTRWWATLMQANPVVAPFKKRIRFEGAGNYTANFPSVLVYSGWRPSPELQQHLWMRSWT